MASIRQAILTESREQKRTVQCLLLTSPMTAGLDPEVVIKVMDSMLNVPKDTVEQLMNASRKCAGYRRELQRWD